MRAPMGLRRKASAVEPMARRERVTRQRRGDGRRVVRFERHHQRDRLAQDEPIDQRPAGGQRERGCRDDRGDKVSIAARTKKKKSDRGGGEEMEEVRWHAAACTENRKE